MSHTDSMQYSVYSTAHHCATNTATALAIAVETSDTASKPGRGVGLEE